MSAAVTVAAAPPTQDRHDAEPVDVAIGRRAFRQIRTGAIVCGLVFGATIASSAISYVSSFPTEASRQQVLAVTAGNTSLAVLLGPLNHVDTVGGYTFYKSWVTLTSIGAIWAVLAATKLFRGEEDSGRWSLVLSGATRASRATVATLVAIAAAVAVVTVETLVLTLLAATKPGVGFDASGSVVMALTFAIAPAVFAVVGACTSQLCATRRLATGVGLAVFGVCFALRMIGDSGAGQHWVLWLTPLGWPDLIQPFTFDDLRPFVPAVITVVALGALAAALAARRDVGAAVLATKDRSDVRPFGLGSALGLTTRLELPVLVVWTATAAIAGILLGVIARITTTASTPQGIDDVLSRFGVGGDFTRQYLGISFLLIATLVAVMPASQMGAAGAEETSGRLVHLLVGPTRRWSWLVGRLVLTGAMVVLAGLAAGFGAWVGTASQGVGIGLTTMVGAGLNVVPTALVALGVGAVVLAVAPRAAATAVYAVVGWSLVVDLLGTLVSGLGWLNQLTLFHHMALSPAEPASATTIVVTLGVALALMAIAVVVFDRRDLQTA